MLPGAPEKPDMALARAARLVPIIAIKKIQALEAGMRKSWVAGFLVFSVVLIVGARHEAVDEFLVWAGICASDSRTPARSASLVLAAVQMHRRNPPQRRQSLVRHRRPAIKFCPRSVAAAT